MEFGPISNCSSLLKSGASDIENFGESKSKRKMGKIMTPEKVAALVGENNVGNFLDRNGNVSPDAVMGMVEIANNIRTACDPEDSPAYGLSHNKQFYSDTGKPKSVTQEER